MRRCSASHEHDRGIERTHRMLISSSRSSEVEFVTAQLSVAETRSCGTGHCLLSRTADWKRSGSDHDEGTSG